jgi:predicted transcriptional regulator
MNNNFFDRVEKKTNVKKEDILSLARSIQNKDLKDEKELKKLIKSVAALAGKDVSKEREAKIIDAIIKDKIPKNIEKKF